MKIIALLIAMMAVIHFLIAGMAPAHDAALFMSHVFAGIAELFLAILVAIKGVSTYE